MTLTTLLPYVLFIMALPFAGGVISVLLTQWGFGAAAQAAAQDSAAGARAGLGILPRGVALARTRVIAAALLACGITVVLSTSLLVGKPSFPPREALHTLPLALAAGLIIGALELSFSLLSTTFASVLLIVGIGVGAKWLLHLTGPYLWVADGVLVWLIVWSALRPSARDQHGPVPVIVLGTFSGACAVVLTASGNLTLGQVAAIMAFTLLGIFAAGLWRGGGVVAGPITCMVAAWCAALIVQGYTYGQTPRPVALTMAVGGPIAVRVCLMLVGRHLKNRWLVACIAGAAMLAVGGACAAWGHLATASSEPEYGS